MVDHLRDPTDGGAVGHVLERGLETFRCRAQCENIAQRNLATSHARRRSGRSARSVFDAQRLELATSRTVADNEAHHSQHLDDHDAGPQKRGDGPAWQAVPTDHSKRSRDVHYMTVRLPLILSPKRKTQLSPVSGKSMGRPVHRPHRGRRLGTLRRVHDTWAPKPSDHPVVAERLHEALSYLRETALTGTSPASQSTPNITPPHHFEGPTTTLAV